jgi:hypothetical protein
MCEVDDVGLLNLNDLCVTVSGYFFSGMLKVSDEVHSHMA